jgi:hypothetical protein
VTDELERSRRRLERGLSELGAAAEAEIGWTPRLSRWAVPILAVAVGLVLGLAVRRSWPRLDAGG